MEEEKSEEQEDDASIETCWKCDGKGSTLIKVPVQRLYKKHFFKEDEYKMEEEEVRTICTACNGTGKLDWITNTLRKDNQFISGYMSGYVGGSAGAFLYPSTPFSGYSLGGYSGYIPAPPIKDEDEQEEL